MGTRFLLVRVPPFSGALLLVAILVRKRFPPYALAPLFFAIVSTVVLPIEQAAKGVYEYPEFSGALMLTILLSGLMMGKSFVRLWTTLCIMFQFAAPVSSWKTDALWDLLYVAAGWLVTQYSWHLERLNLAVTAPPRSSSATRLSPNARVSRGTSMIRWRKVSPAS